MFSPHSDTPSIDQNGSTKTYTGLYYALLIHLDNDEKMHSNDISNIRKSSSLSTSSSLKDINVKLSIHISAILHTADYSKPVFISGVNIEVIF